MSGSVGADVAEQQAPGRRRRARPAAPAARHRPRSRSGSAGRSCGSCDTAIARTRGRRRRVASSRSRSSPRRLHVVGQDEDLLGQQVRRCVSSRCRTRSTMTRVLPVPAPAMTTTGPSPALDDRALLRRELDALRCHRHVPPSPSIPVQRGDEGDAVEDHQADRERDDQHDQQPADAHHERRQPTSRRR